MNVEQLLAVVDDLSVFTTTTQLADRLQECRTAYDGLQGTKDLSGKAQMLLSASTRIENKIVAIHFSQRREAQRALKAAATIPRESFSAPIARAHR